MLVKFQRYWNYFPTAWLIIRHWIITYTRAFDKIQQFLVFALYVLQMRCLFSIHHLQLKILTNGARFHIMSIYLYAHLVNADYFPFNSSDCKIANSWDRKLGIECASLKQFEIVYFTTLITNAEKPVSAHRKKCNVNICLVLNCSCNDVFKYANLIYLNKGRESTVDIQPPLRF